MSKEKYWGKCSNLNDLRKKLDEIANDRCYFKRGAWFYIIKGPNNENRGREVDIEDNEELEDKLQYYTGIKFSVTFIYNIKWHTACKAGRLLIRKDRSVRFTPGFWGDPEYCNTHIKEPLEKAGILT